MSSHRNKLLIKLSQNSVQHYNNSNCATMVSNISRDLEKVTETNTNRPSLCIPYDHILDSCLDFRVIEPFLPVSESENFPSFFKQTEERNYAELKTVDVDGSSIMQRLQIPESIPIDLIDSIEFPVNYDFVTVTTKAVIEQQPHCNEVTLIPTTETKEKKPHAMDDINYDEITPAIAEDSCSLSMKRNVTSNEEPIDIENQEQDVEILQPKKLKRLRNPKDILVNQKQKHMGCFHPSSTILYHLSVTVKSHVVNT